jgi:RNA polymerase sigma factor (sigma-70 family)
MSGRSTDRDPEFELLYAQHFERLIITLVLVGTQRETAEDLAQEAFARVLMRLDGIRDPAAYLYRTAFRLRGRHLRRQVRATFVAETRTADASAAEEPAIRQREVVDLLRTLTRRQRECVVLAFYVGHSAEEAAAILGIRASTVRVHIHAARSAVRRGSDRKDIEIA